MKHITIKQGENRTIVDNADREQEAVYEVKENAQLTVVIIAHGAHVASRHIRLSGRGASAHILGFIIGSGDAEMILHTMQHHEAPEATSNLLVKCVLNGNARFTFDGAIRVEKEAQKTDAYQRNENLLLSSSAHARSKPSLEILANDVRCTHGATLGTIDNEQLYYLRSRGLGKDLSRQLIIDGFFESALSKISDKNVIESVRSTLWELL